MMQGKLYLIPSPLSPETEALVLPAIIKERIQSVNYFLVENERTARRFISALKTEKDISLINFTLLDKDTTAESLDVIFKLLKEGTDVGVISEAGCPGVADPGALAVEMAHKHHIEVVPLVGPSSILLALMGSGFSGQSFTFHGYLPIDKPERIKSIKQLERDAQSKTQTQIFIETPYRNNAMLADILANCQPKTRICIASDLTSPAQFLKTQTIQEWKNKIPDLNKKPTVFLLF